MQCFQRGAVSMIVPIYLNQFDKMGQCYCGILGQAQLIKYVFISVYGTFLTIHRVVQHINFIIVFVGC